MDSKLLEFDLLLEMNVIERLDGVHIIKMAEVRFVNLHICAAKFPSKINSK